MSRIQIPRKWDALTDYQAWDYIQSWVKYLLKHHKLYRARVYDNRIVIAGLEIKQIKTPRDENAVSHSGDIYGFYVNGKNIYLHDEILMNNNGDLFYDIVKLYNKILYRKEPLRAKVREYWIDKNMSVSLPQLGFVVVYTAVAVGIGYMAGQQSQQDFNKPSHNKSDNIVNDTVPSETVIYGDVRDFMPAKQEIAQPSNHEPENIVNDTVDTAIQNDTVKQQPDTVKFDTATVIYGDVRDFMLQQQKQR